MSSKKKKIPAICLDFDDTIADFLNYLCRLHNKLHGTCISEDYLTDWDFAGLKFEDRRGNKVTGRQLRKTFQEFEKEGFYSAMPVDSKSKDAIHLMKMLGYKIIVITARKKQFQKQTELNVMMNDLEIDHIIYESNKVLALKKLRRKYEIFAFADDKYETIVDVSENSAVKKVFIVNKAHNIKKELDPEIIRVNSIFGIIEYLKDVRNGEK